MVQFIYFIVTTHRHGTSARRLFTVRSQRTPLLFNTNDAQVAQQELLMKNSTGYTYVCVLHISLSEI